MEDVLKIIEKQQMQIEQLEKQVSSLLSRDTNGNNCDNKMVNGELGQKIIQNGKHREGEGSENEDRAKGGMTLENRVLELEVVTMFIQMLSKTLIIISPRMLCSR